MLTRPPAPTRAELVGASLTWKRTGTGWRLWNGNRRFGDVVPDGKYPGMWRVVLHDGRLSDMANLSWARSAVLTAATLELEYESRHPSITRDSGAVFPGRRSLARPNGRGGS
jgi:hypothetical protein